MISAWPVIFALAIMMLYQKGKIAILEKRLRISQALEAPALPEPEPQKALPPAPMEYGKSKPTLDELLTDAAASYDLEVDSLLKQGYDCNRIDKYRREKYLSPKVIVKLERECALRQEIAQLTAFLRTIQ